MTNDEWIARLAELPPQHRILAELIMERLNTVIQAHANRQLEDSQRLERRIEVLRGRIEVLEGA